jgi:hypothetical protein
MKVALIFNEGFPEYSVIGLNYEARRRKFDNNTHSTMILRWDQPHNFNRQRDTFEAGAPSIFEKKFSRVTLNDIKLEKTRRINSLNEITVWSRRLMTKWNNSYHRARYQALRSWKQNIYLAQQFHKINLWHVHRSYFSQTFKLDFLQRWAMSLNDLPEQLGNFSETNCKSLTKKPYYLCDNHHNQGEIRKRTLSKFYRCSHRQQQQ